jgi:hypothetical protein
MPGVPHACKRTGLTSVASGGVFPSSPTDACRHVLTQYTDKSMTSDSFTTLYERVVDPQRLMSPFITGHLVLEFLLRKLVQIYDPSLTRIADDLNHARLISLNHDIGTITNRQKDALVKINKMRNKFAHQITYQPTLQDLKSLFTTCKEAFSDLTDGIEQGLGEIDGAQSVDDLEEWVLSELFVQIAYDLHHAYQDRGGDMEDF